MSHLPPESGLSDGPSRRVRDGSHSDERRRTNYNRTHPSEHDLPEHRRNEVAHDTVGRKVACGGGWSDEGKRDRKLEPGRALGEQQELANGKQCPSHGQSDGD